MGSRTAGGTGAEQPDPDARRALLGGRSIRPEAIGPSPEVADLLDGAFQAYNAARLREAAQLLAGPATEPDTVVGLSLTGALTPAGLGMSCLVPLVEHGLVDWVISTGANLYHDTHFAIGRHMHRGRFDADDTVLRDAGVVRIYDIFFEYDVLLDTDAFFRQVLRADEFQRPMGTAEFHHRVGAYVAAREEELGLEGVSFVAACHRAGVPVYTSSPGDSSIGMNVAALALEGKGVRFDPSTDVNETAALVLAAKRGLLTGGDEGKSCAWIVGGGSPKNFLLQTEPQIQEVLGIDEKGHDYFVQITDARPDTGGLSGATPGEAVSWGKVDPDRLPDAVVCHTDATIALPLLTAYLRTRREPRPLRRLYDRREECMDLLRREFDAAGRD